MVRGARGGGGLSTLFPVSCSGVEDIPWDLNYAINFAIKVCYWQENIPSDDMPPDWMLPFEDELELWFEEVDRKRNSESGGSYPEAPDMVKNEYSDRFK